jgi:hypothetical protein
VSSLLPRLGVIASRAEARKEEPEELPASISFSTGVNQSQWTQDRQKDNFPLQFIREPYLDGAI